MSSHHSKSQQSDYSTKCAAVLGLKPYAIGYVHALT